MNSTKQPNGARGLEADPGSRPSAAMIVGCGFLGRVLAARLRGAAFTVYGTFHHPAAEVELEAIGVRPLWFDADDPRLLSSLHRVPAETSFDIYYLIPPGPAGGHDDHKAQRRFDGMNALLRTLGAFPVRRAVLCSSTAVYGDSRGASVSADTPPQPRDARAGFLFEIERRWLDSGLPARVVRLAGLYGPGRIVGLSVLRRGEPIGGDPDALLNLIHVDDAATLMMTVAASASAAVVELGSNGRPIRRRDYYEYLAASLGVTVHWADPATGVGYAAGRGRVSRACDIRPTCARTGWQPIHTDFRATLQALLALADDRSGSIKG